MIEKIKQQYKKELELLEQHGYHFNEECFCSDNGCYIDHNFADVSYYTFLSLFIVEKYQELIEQKNTSLTLDEENVLSYYGYSLICSSPFEIQDRNGKMITGEFAHLFYQELKNKYIEDTTII